MGETTQLRIPDYGERALIVGQTGSGKTAFASWVLRRMKPSPIVIYDTKVEEKFPQLGKSRIANSWKEVRETVQDEKIDYIIFRPSAQETAEPDILDGYLHRHYQELQGVGVYIDELYTFHRGTKAGPGLIAVLTRGRSLGISTVMSTQRPAWISRFCLSEAQILYIFSLNDKRDMVTLSAVIPGFEKLPPAPRHYFYFYEAGEAMAKLYYPVKLDKGIDTGYTGKTVQIPNPRQWI